MHNILDKSLKLRKSPNFFARICGEAGVRIAVFHAKQIEKKVKKITVDQSVVGQKEIVRKRIMDKLGEKDALLLQKRNNECYNYPRNKVDKGGRKMAKVYTFLATGFEEVEALTAVDLLRRAGVEVCMVSIMDRLAVTGAQGITVQAEKLYKEIDPCGADLLLLPGGQPGTTNLGDYEPLTELLKAWNKEGKKLAAICAAPTVLGGLGLLEGKKATCYPGCERQLTGAQAVTDRVVTDGNITTSRGVGTAISFSLELIKILVSPEKAEEIRTAIVYGH